MFDKTLLKKIDRWLERLFCWGLPKRSQRETPSGQPLHPNCRCSVPLPISEPLNADEALKAMQELIAKKEKEYANNVYARDPLWDAFRRSEDRDWCCRMVINLKDKIGALSVTFTVDGTACAMPVRHCPRCGRNLEA